jgi:hypothetical protein
MSHSQSMFLETFYEISKQHICRPVFICGAEGSGKRIFCEALRNMPGPYVMHIPLSRWFRMSPERIMMEWQKAKDLGDSQGKEALAGYSKIVNWDKFSRDIRLLTSKGYLRMTCAYDEKTGRAMDPHYLRLPMQGERLLLISGTCLLHRPATDIASKVFFLEETYNILARRAGASTFPYRSASHNEQRNIWADKYFIRHARNALQISEKTRTWVVRTFTKTQPACLGCGVAQTGDELCIQNTSNRGVVRPKVLEDLSIERPSDSVKGLSLICS